MLTARHYCSHGPACVWRFVSEPKRYEPLTSKRLSGNAPASPLKLRVSPISNLHPSPHERKHPNHGQRHPCPVDGRSPASQLGASRRAHGHGGYGSRLVE